MSEQFHAWNFQVADTQLDTTAYCLVTKLTAAALCSLTVLVRVCIMKQNVQSVGGGFLTHEDTLRFFVGARSGDCTGARTCTDKLNGTWDGNGTTGTATLRRDGFASITPSAPPTTAGVLTTPPLEFIGTHLFVNLLANSTASGLFVELMDATGTVVHKSQRLEEVDSTRLAVDWEGEVDLGNWAQASTRGVAPPRLRFTLTGTAHLYSFWFSADPKCGASLGPVAAGGSTFTSAWDTHGACKPAE